jgi:hypothetical protein
MIHELLQNLINQEKKKNKWEDKIIRIINLVRKMRENYLFFNSLKKLLSV